MATQIMKLDDGTFVEVELSPGEARPIAASGFGTISTSLKEIQPLLKKICEPINAVWKELNQDMHIEQAEVELGLSFEGQGNIFITKAKAGANLTIKLILEPKGQQT